MTGSFNSSNFDCTNEGLKYVAGYLAHSFRTKYPLLGAKTSEYSEIYFNGIQAPWIWSLTRGGLTVPSTDFFQKICLFEKLFCDYHGDKVCTDRKIVDNLTNKIFSLYPEMKRDIIQKFVCTRTFIRIKFLNHQLRAEAESARARNLMKKRHFMN